MIQKRYQYYSSQGVLWSPWSDYEKDNSRLSQLQLEEQWQLKPKLRNEYRIV